MNKAETKSMNIRKTISLIQEFMVVDEIKTMKNDHFDDYTVYMKEIFPDFSTRFEALFGLVISGENVSAVNITKLSSVKRKHK